MLEPNRFRALGLSGNVPKIPRRADNILGFRSVSRQHKGGTGRSYVVNQLPWHRRDGRWHRIKRKVTQVELNGWLCSVKGTPALPECPYRYHQSTPPSFLPSLKHHLDLLCLILLSVDLNYVFSSGVCCQLSVSCKTVSLVESVYIFSLLSVF